MLGIYEIHYKTRVTIATHSGWCSGADCEDEDEELYEYTEVVLSKQNSKFFNFLLHRLPLKRLETLLDLSQYCEADKDGILLGKSECMGSGYCGASHSGLKHDYSINCCKLKTIEFSHNVLLNEREESYILATHLNNLKIRIYNILYCLKSFKIVKDMRVLIISKFLEN